MNKREKLREEAEQFLRQYFAEMGKENEFSARWHAVEAEIAERGTYDLTYEELQFGARVAWRNSNRCIGRLFWSSMHVRDARYVTTNAEMQHEIEEHVRYATNNGKILPTITVFPHEQDGAHYRIWNHQIIRYAGFETADGIIGDPHSVEFTKLCQNMGWKSEIGRFQLMPVVIETPSGVSFFELNENDVQRVAIEHPEYDFFREMALQWYAVPIISEMKLDIGGLQFTAAPFNGWYMGTEIGARNFADEARYNLLPEVAAKLGLNTSRNMTLWRDRALVELNIAVLHSYRRDGVTIVDHHTASQQYGLFEQQEADAGRKATGNWAWLIPPMSPATSHIFHERKDNTIMKPNYFYQPKRYETPQQ